MLSKTTLKLNVTSHIWCIAVHEYEFLEWCPNGLCAIMRNKATHEKVAVPFSRLIPHPLCEAYWRSKGITDPNEIARRCAEEGSVFGIAIFRHELHLKLRYNNTLKREPEKEYPFPPTIDFSCVRDKIIAGEDTDKAIKECS